MKIYLTIKLVNQLYVIQNNHSFNYVKIINPSLNSNNWKNIIYVFKNVEKKYGKLLYNIYRVSINSLKMIYNYSLHMDDNTIEIGAYHTSG